MNKALLKSYSRKFALAGAVCGFGLSAASGESAWGESSEQWLRQGREAVERALEVKPIERRAKNVILFVGDGMGISTVTAARILEGQLRGEAGEENHLAFERLPYTALSKTYNTNQQTADSAGTMTAMITGAKTKAGLISVGQEAIRGDAASAGGRELLTLLEKAEIAGKATGIVTTTRLTHATPAACYAHVPERDWEGDAKVPPGLGIRDIAAQLIEMPRYWSQKGFPQVDGPEVALGGGRAFFFPEGSIGAAYSSEGDRGGRLDGRNLAEEWLATREKGAYVHDLAGFQALELGATGPVLGLFEGSHLNYEAERREGKGDEPSLAQMTVAALEILERREDGFFLMVEGGRIDHAHHAGNAYRALVDALAFAEAVEAALDAVDLEETLIIVTADHSHVFTMAGYPTRGNGILGLVVGNDQRGEPSDRFATDALGLPYTTLGYANGPGYVGASDAQPEGAKSYPHAPWSFEAAKAGRPNLAEALDVVPQEMECGDFANHLHEATIPMSSETHGGEDVGVWAAGPYAHLIRGTIEQNVIFHVMDYAFGFGNPE